MLTLVIGEAALELVPPSIADHPVIVKSARRRGKPAEKILLDSNFHHAAMRKLKESRKRGRPDIVHVVLLCALESVLNKQNNLHIYIHARNNDIIYVNPETRIPRSYNRFCGLIEKLFEKRSVENLLSLEKSHLLDFVEKLPGAKIVMEQKGNPLVLKKDAVYIVGGFPHGEFSARLPYPTQSIADKPLTAWTVVNELVVRYELL